MEVEVVEASAVTYRSPHHIRALVVWSFWQWQNMVDSIRVAAPTIAGTASTAPTITVACTCIAGDQTQQQHAVVVFFGAAVNQHTPRIVRLQRHS